MKVKYQKISYIKYIFFLKKFKLNKKHFFLGKILKHKIVLVTVI